MYIKVFNPGDRMLDTEAMQLAQIDYRLDKELFDKYSKLFPGFWDKWDNSNKPDTINEFMKYRRNSSVTHIVAYEKENSTDVMASATCVIDPTKKYVKSTWEWCAEPCLKGVSGIFGIYTLPEYRGRGLGRALIAKAEEVTKSVGLSRIEIGVGSYNTNAYKLYKSLGYKQIEIAVIKSRSKVISKTMNSWQEVRYRSKVVQNEIRSRMKQEIRMQSYMFGPILEAQAYLLNKVDEKCSTQKDEVSIYYNKNIDTYLGVTVWDTRTNIAFVLPSTPKVLNTKQGKDALMEIDNLFPSNRPYTEFTSMNMNLIDSFRSVGYQDNHYDLMKRL